jgi:hypothetical protein
VWRRLGIATTGHSREDQTAGPAPASIADELGGTDGAAEIGPAERTPVIDKAGGATAIAYRNQPRFSALLPAKRADSEQVVLAQFI